VKIRLSHAAPIALCLSLTAGFAGASRAETFFQCGPVIQNHPCSAGTPFRSFVLPGRGPLFPLNGEDQGGLQEPRARMAPEAFEALLAELMEERPAAVNEADLPRLAEEAKYAQRQDLWDMSPGRQKMTPVPALGR
jgi:hypothetical protein